MNNKIREKVIVGFMVLFAIFCTIYELVKFLR